MTAFGKVWPVHSISRQLRLITLIRRRYYPASMAKHSSHILELARKGAEHRYEELKAEIATLFEHFPHLSGLASVSHAIDVSAVPAATIGRKLRSRSRMSAAHRAAVSDVSPVHSLAPGIRFVEAEASNVGASAGISSSSLAS
jgi:hypothetical protein